MPAKVAAIEYDPNRQPESSLLHYADGEKRYILHPVGLEVGVTVQTGEGADILPGNALQIRNIPPGTMVHNLELYRRARALSWCVRRAARRSCSAKKATSRWSSCPRAKFANFRSIAWRRSARSATWITKTKRTARRDARAGTGVRPTVRGVAMNPVDHPHGGGEGRVKGNHPQTPWGFPTLGEKTRKRKRTDRQIVQRRKP